MPSLLNAIISIFRKKKIVFTGRVGMVFYFKNRKYFIDSEMLTGGEYDIAVFIETIRYKDIEMGKLSSLEKNEVLKELIVEFNKLGLRPEFINN